MEDLGVDEFLVAHRAFWYLITWGRFACCHVSAALKIIKAE
jgi:hypothetical protein